MERGEAEALSASLQRDHGFKTDVEDVD